MTDDPFEYQTAILHRPGHPDEHRRIPLVGGRPPAEFELPTDDTRRSYTLWRLTGHDPELTYAFGGVTERP